MKLFLGPAHKKKHQVYKKEKTAENQRFLFIQRRDRVLNL